MNGTSSSLVLVAQTLSPSMALKTTLSGAVTRNSASPSGPRTTHCPSWTSTVVVSLSHTCPERVTSIP